jgi:hydroxymethylpyrimidine pyrophosphatase-like HAD family hydrolase
MHEIRRWGIPFDFLICANGAMLYDKQQRLLQSSSIPDALIKDILQHPAAQSSLHCEICSNGTNMVHIKSQSSWFCHIDAAFLSITFEESLAQGDVQQVSLAYTTEAEYISAADALTADYKDALSLNLNNHCIDINNFGINKLSGIASMLAIHGWPQQELLVIGDGENDISMIRHFKGFSMKHAHNRVTRHATAVYTSVADMLTKHI